MIVTNECRFTVEELKEDLEELKEDLEELSLKKPENCKFYTAGLAVKEDLEELCLKVGVIGEL
tara:strand:+ start:41 stop:229 length:189 start_codon:yes stop_codon:yes gene_type:complete